MNKALYITTFLLGIALGTQAQTDGSSRQRTSTGTKTESNVQPATPSKEHVGQTQAADRRRAEPADIRQENKQTVPDSSAARRKRAEE